MSKSAIAEAKNFGGFIMNVKKMLSLFLIVCILVTALVVPTVNAVEVKDELVTVGAEDYGLVDDVQQGQILQCWNWSFDQIKANMKTIAEQGFSAVQTSPIQQPKESTSGASVNDKWWMYYQPAYFKIDTTNSNALGNKTSFTAMCAEAEKYGVKVIVDAVLNHTGNNSRNDISNAVDPELKNNSSCWHNISINTSNWNDRYDVTQHCMDGLPDLNTANSIVQAKATAFLKECIDCGADGFRFDGAKHIETPADASNCRSDFWPNVLGAATSYAQSKGQTVYYYGEVLNEIGGISVSEYTKFMSVSANCASKDIRNKVNSNNASGAARKDFTFLDGNNPAGDKAVLWNESHDEYVSGGSDSISVANMNKVWAVIGARSEACAMYFARPNNKGQQLGIGSKTGWANPEVKAVNQFNNFFGDESESLASSGNFFYNERGTSGVVIVNCGGTSSSVSLKANKMQDGTYVDHVSGNTFTVSNGTIKGNIGSTGIAVVYNPVVKPKATISQSGGNFKTDTLTLTLGLANATSGTYKIGNEAAKSFTGTTTITIGKGVAYNKAITVVLTATDGTETTESTYTFQKIDPLSVNTIRFDNSNTNWSQVYFYIYDESGSSVREYVAWPGTKVTDVSNNIYSMEVPEGYENCKVIFNNYGSNQIPAQNESGFTVSDGSYIYKNGEWSEDIIVIPTEPAKTYKRGDINVDGYTDILDATLIQKHCAKMITFNDFEICAADVDGDNYASINDAAVIQKLTSKMISSLPAGDTFEYIG